MKIHEVSTAAGLLSVELRADGDTFVLVTGNVIEPLPDGAIDAIMKRFGKPLDPDVDLVEVAALSLPSGRLRHVRHLARYDVIARDFLVLESEESLSAGAAPSPPIRAGEPALCALATVVAGALAHLAKSLGARGRT